MRVLVTGATGFVGAHFLRCLDSPVAILLRPQSNPWRIGELLDRVAIVRDEPEIVRFAPDTIVHLAWSGVGHRERNDIRQLENITNTAALVETAHRCGVKHWIGLGSQAEYGPCGSRIGEDTATRPTTLYGIAKLAAGQVTRNLCEQFGMRYVWLRLFSSYGPQDDPGWMLPYLILELLDGRKPSLTAGEQRWDYLYITDVAKAVYTVAMDAAASGIYNLGSGQAWPLRKIVETARDLIDPRLPLGFGEVPYRPDQVMHLEADITRLQQLGWRAQVGLEEGLRRTVEWYRKVSQDSLPDISSS